MPSYNGVFKEKSLNNIFYLDSFFISTKTVICH